MNHRSQAPDLENLSFEDALGELDAIVQQLEAGDLPLEESIALYERGMALARRCGQALDAAELRVQQLAVAGDQQQLGFFLDEDDPAG